MITAENAAKKAVFDNSIKYIVLICTIALAVFGFFICN